MTPDRSRTIGGHKIEQYTWGGKLVVYVDNRLSKYSFDDACKLLEAEDEATG